MSTYTTTHIAIHRLWVLDALHHRHIVDSSTSPVVATAPCPYPSTSMTPCPTFVPTDIFHRSMTGFLHIHGYVDERWCIRELGSSGWWHICSCVDGVGWGTDDSLCLFSCRRGAMVAQTITFCSFLCVEDISLDLVYGNLTKLVSLFLIEYFCDLLLCILQI